MRIRATLDHPFAEVERTCPSFFFGGILISSINPATRLTRLHWGGGWLGTRNFGTGSDTCLLRLTSPDRERHPAPLGGPAYDGFPS